MSVEAAASFRSGLADFPSWPEPGAHPNRLDNGRRSHRAAKRSNTEEFLFSSPH
jgi:hypothetical protein